MPGKRNRSHVPPMASRASSTAHTTSRPCFDSRQATSTPAMPAPMTSTSTSSGGAAGTSAAVSSAGSVWVIGEVGVVGSGTASGYCDLVPLVAGRPTSAPNSVVAAVACDDWGMTTLSDFTATTLTGDERRPVRLRRPGRPRRQHGQRLRLHPAVRGPGDALPGLHDEGLVVLGFPCNQFGSQEPGTEEEIGEFCQVNYGVSFPMFAKVDVNGEDAHPLFTLAQGREERPARRQDQVELHQVPRRPRRPGHQALRPDHRAEGHRRRHPRRPLGRRRLSEPTAQP